MEGEGEPHYEEEILAGVAFAPLVQPSSNPRSKAAVVTPALPPTGARSQTPHPHTLNFNVENAFAQNLKRQTNNPRTHKVHPNTEIWGLGGTVGSKSSH